MSSVIELLPNHNSWKGIYLTTLHQFLFGDSPNIDFLIERSATYNPQDGPEKWDLIHSISFLLYDKIGQGKYIPQATMDKVLLLDVHFDIFDLGAKMYGIYGARDIHEALVIYHDGDRYKLIWCEDTEYKRYELALELQKRG